MREMIDDRRMAGQGMRGRHGGEGGVGQSADGQGAREVRRSSGCAEESRCSSRARAQRPGAPRAGCPTADKRPCASSMPCLGIRARCPRRQGPGGAGCAPALGRHPTTCCWRAQPNRPIGHGQRPGCVSTGYPPDGAAGPVHASVRLGQPAGVLDGQAHRAERR